MGKLAINGGSPVRSTLFPAQNTIGHSEKEAVMRVMDGYAILTGYQGNWGPNFRGGPEVRALEEEWAEKFGVKHAIACNSATSGLFIACGAVNLGELDDEGPTFNSAIVSPFSMTCSATVPMGWGARPIFADIERDYYCIDYQSVKEKYSAYTKAVIPVSLFGQPYNADGINANAHERGALVIEDAAQALGSKLNGKYAGTLGDIGVYSFNLGKHLTCGEGGMMVTDDDELAMRCRLIMNHAEAVVNDAYGKTEFMIGQFAPTRFRSLFGFNLRLPEISAAIMRVQLAKMDWLIKQRVDNVDYLVNRLKDIPCLEMPKVRPGATHTYYVLPLKYKYGKQWTEEEMKQPQPYIHRDKFVAAVKAELQPVMGRESEGVTISNGYIRPIQNMPLFGRSLDETPECKRQWQDELIIVHRIFGPMASRKDLDDVANAFEKVWTNREELL